MLLAVSTDGQKKQRKTNMACVNLWARPAGSSVLFVGPSFSCALLSLWPLIRFLVPSRKKSTSPQSFLLPLSSRTYTHTHTHLHSPQGCTPSLSSSVHFLSAGQHCLLEEREHEEDTGSLPPLALGEVIRHDIIYKEKGKNGHKFTIHSESIPTRSAAIFLYYLKKYWTKPLGNNPDENKTNA